MPCHPALWKNRRNRPREFWRVLTATWPVAFRDGITGWAQFFFQGGGRPERRDAVHSGGTDVVSTSSTHLVYAVYGVVELFLLDRDSAQWRWQWSSPSLVQSACATCCSDSLSQQVASSVSSLSVSEHEMKEQSSQAIGPQRWEKGLRETP